MKNQLGGISLILGLLFFFILVFFFNSSCTSINGISSFGCRGFLNSTALEDDSATSLKHLAFGLQGSEKTYHFRRYYVESWWRPNELRGYVYLDRAPQGDLIPWPKHSPPFRVNDNITKLLDEIKPVNPLMPRMVHGILELFREEHKDLRWLIMGDDDTIFFVDNLIEVLSKYDHREYYYIGNPSEFVLSNFWYNFNQAFGGGGIILSYPLAKALVDSMDLCLRMYSNLSADLMTMACLADLGVNLTPHKGLHQMDLRGDVSGFLSAHPKDLALSFHHIDSVDPYFPSMDRANSLKHLMKASNVDQSRLFQQTICYEKAKNWSFSTSWGYSAHIYEKIMPRSWLTRPIETFKTWQPSPNPPHYMFNTRNPSSNPCETPHLFFLESVRKTWGGHILTRYSRSAPRNIPACAVTGNHSAEVISKIDVISPATKRYEVS
ncbi:OLC1v1005425C2 [Oldenlandia corymbosa var. corymbosa]|uniref:OLC1v1005425C2 n=1 Tax=Oldenlandia corymbosa var. corymbosa TaxID=529605 RepID=A0AAV1DH04_OLDCO|nr:OLC1v1005425C2 [Oldenlandia corymbosa var. corymbosa]